MQNLLRKFSLHDCDFPTILWYIDVLFRSMTIKIHRNNSQKISILSYLITIFSGLSYVYAYVFSMVWFVFVRCQETSQFKTAIIVFSVTMCSITCVPKTLYMKCYSNSIMNLVENYLKCNKAVMKGTRFETNFLGMLNVIKKEAMTAWVVLVMNGLVYVIVPFLRPGRHLTQDLLVLYGLEPMYESPNFEIASVLMIASSYFALFIVSYVLLFIILIVGFLEAQLLALSLELANLWDDSEKFYNYRKFYDEVVSINATRNMFITIRLRDIVKFHILNVKLRCKIENNLRFIFFNDLIFMVFAIVAELICGLENTGLQMPFTLGLICLDCYIGQRLIDAGTTFEKAVYSCKWENFQVSNQKSVLIMLQCSARTMTLSPGGMTVLDYPFLMAVFKSTYSAYTTLKSSE